MCPVPRKIVFTPTRPVAEPYKPKPAKHAIPQWYKDTPSYDTGKREVINGHFTQTVKKCIPFFDALTGGYIIPLWTDIYVSKEDGDTKFNIPNSVHDIGLHPLHQAELHPLSQGTPYPKLMNPWAIRTPQGYSCLVAAPFHNPNPYFVILDGIVDTDTYTAPINFPFVLKDRDFSGLIPAGTPVAQIIPFKRDEWQMNIGTDDDSIKKASVLVASRWFDSYKSQFWHRKSFN